jgi:hypothetical protein
VAAAEGEVSSRFGSAAGFPSPVPRVRCQHLFQQRATDVRGTDGEQQDGHRSGFHSGTDAASSRMAAAAALDQALLMNPRRTARCGYQPESCHA